MDETRLDQLIEKYADGTATPEELEELFNWYRSADIQTVEWPADHADEKEQLQDRMLQRLQQQMQQSKGRPRLYHMRGWRVAASLILIAAAVWITRQYTSKAAPLLTVTNPAGKIQAIRLPDSSRVWLNAASSLRYPSHFTNRREIYLEGEAYFDVANDPAHPFIVHAGSLTTTVLGTIFDVRSFPMEQQASISVIRGKVQVQDSARVLDVLTPSRQLQHDIRTGKTQTITIDTNQVAGWQQGRLQFSGQSMEEIAASLGRWYNVQFIFASPAIRKCRYYLNFENTISLTSLLEILEVSTGKTFRLDKESHTVTIAGGDCL